VTGVRHLTTGPDDADMRFDRWFHREFPQVSHGHLAKLLRTGQIRLDGRRFKAGDRLAGGETVRVPPLPDAADASRRSAPVREPDQADMADLRARVLYRDDDLIALDKPSGLAVQGGTGTKRHLDGMLDGLRFGAPERPRLVHRLDRDTSGVLLLARSSAAARALGALFKSHETDKTYWALVAGRPDDLEGVIDLPLAKQPGRGGERVRVDHQQGQRAVSRYRVIDSAGDKVSWLELKPLTGRTHQLRVHCAAMNWPILGDGKYGGSDAFLAGVELVKRVHLHARAIGLPGPRGKTRTIEAPLPADLIGSWQAFGFDPAEAT
jgi:23S rRNA pseudouridine955/2504/2580 synthase